MESLKKYIYTMMIVLGNMMLLCVYHINWNWNIATLIRIFLPIFLFSHFDPIVSMMITEGILDSVEPNINRNNVNYHIRDKILDLWGWTISFIYLWISPTLPLFLKSNRLLLTILFVIRFIGNIIFINTKKRRILSILPNLYSPLFILLGLVDALKLNKYSKHIILPFLILKCIIEYFHHASNTSKKIKPLRKYMRCLCHGKTEMYRKTGTFPDTEASRYAPAPMLKF